MDSGLQLKFYKYQGTGNDFVLIDNRHQFFPKNNTKLVAFLCDRKFGIGADGLILLENDELSDFKMVYYNSDGNESTMCGNGGRCIVAFAKKLGLIENETIFNAIDGLHKATITQDLLVNLQMIDVEEIKNENWHGRTWRIDDTIIELNFKAKIYLALYPIEYLKNTKTQQ